MVMLPAMIAEGLFVDVLLGANKPKAVGACLNITQLENRAKDRKALAEELPNR